MECYSATKNVNIYLLQQNEKNKRCLKSRENTNIELFKLMFHIKKSSELKYHHQK